MATNYLHPGGILDFTNDTGSDIASNDVVELGDSIGVALNDIATTNVGGVGIEGVYSLPKASGTAWSAGDKLDWDTSAGAFDKGITADTGDVTGCAIAAKDAASGDTTGEVKLANPGTLN